MSRTIKDTPWNLRYESYSKDYALLTYENNGYNYSSWLHKPTTKTKKRKTTNTEYLWLKSTPSWWARMFMIRPRRNYENRQMHSVLNHEDLEEFDFVDLKKKNHVYYY